MSLKRINRRVEQLYKEWRSLQPLKPEDDERLWKKIRFDWNYDSNRIEGNTLTYGETELLLIHGRAGGDHPIRDYEEMKAHDLAIEKVREYARDKERNLTEADIRDLNQIILKESFWKEAQTPDGKSTQKQIVPGKYKTQPNHVRTATGELFEFALPEEVPAKMSELMKWFTLKIENPTVPIASFLAELHHRFVLIHPFDDGNGRIVRIWINYVLIRLGYPPLVIKSKDREGYISALQKADTGDIDALAVYLGEELIAWLEIGTKAARGESVSEPDDVDREVDIFIKNKKVEGLEKGGILSKKILQELKEHWIMLFETVEDKFKQFEELFYKSEVLLFMDGTGFNEWRTPLENFLNSWPPASKDVKMEFDILYERYRQSDSPFNMKLSLLVLMNKYNYEIVTRYIIDSDIQQVERDTTGHEKGIFPMPISEQAEWGERSIVKSYYVCTESEIKELVAEVKNFFFEGLKKAVDAKRQRVM